MRWLTAPSAPSLLSDSPLVFDLHPFDHLSAFTAAPQSLLMLWVKSSEVIKRCYGQDHTQREATTLMSWNNEHIWGRKDASLRECFPACYLLPWWITFTPGSPTYSFWYKDLISIIICQDWRGSLFNNCLKQSILIFQKHIEIIWTPFGLLMIHRDDKILLVISKFKLILVEFHSNWF